MTQLHKEALAWMLYGETGASSKAIVARLVMNNTGGHLSYPLDPSDLGRCIELLETVPGLKRRFKLMADCGSVWAALVADWPKLTKLYKAEAPSGRCPKTYYLMKKIIYPITAKATATAMEKAQ